MRIFLTLMILTLTVLRLIRMIRRWWWRLICRSDALCRCSLGLRMRKLRRLVFTDLKCSIFCRADTERFEERRWRDEFE